LTGLLGGVAAPAAVASAVLDPINVVAGGDT
jgi:hypothetical protein